MISLDKNISRKGRISTSVELRHLIESIGNCQLPSNLENFEVEGITSDSHKVKNNFVFVAVKGNLQDGHKFIPEAIKRGAKAIFAQSSVLGPQSSTSIPFIFVSDTRKALASLASAFYNHPSSKIKVIGITGTNGKTTISYLLETILNKAGTTPAVIGTVNYRYGKRTVPSKNTTPGPVEMQSMFADMLLQGCDYAVMEVSSHALDQNRTGGVNFHSAIFTNLTQDHLDYHETLENYFQAKCRLFKGLDPGSFAVINNDSEYAVRLKELTNAQIVGYAIDNPSDVTARDIKFDITHTEFDLLSPKGEARIKTRLIGRYNIYNILAASAWALKEGIDLELVESALEDFSLVPGRLQKIDSLGGFSVFVDYAHTQDALENVIKTLRQLTKDRIIVVFGCGGGRDKTKRPRMGFCVSELSDYAIITNDNPRAEDPQSIIEDIKKGIRKDNYRVIVDRKLAIRESLLLAKPGDIVLIAGKGHETYQIIKDQTIHFDDCEVVRECLRSMNY